VPTYTEILNTLHKDLVRLGSERESVNQKIAKLVKAIEAVQMLAAEEELVIQPPTMPPDMEAGFTDRVRNILKANQYRPLTAVEIRDVLLKETPKDDPKVTLIHAHNTLKRLKAQDEVEESDGPEGRKAYRLKVTFMDAVMATLNTPNLASDFSEAYASVFSTLADGLKETPKGATVGELRRRARELADAGKK